MTDEPCPRVAPGEGHEHGDGDEADEQPVVSHHRHLEPHRDEHEHRSCAQGESTRTDDQQDRQHSEDRGRDDQRRQPPVVERAPARPVAGEVRQSCDAECAGEPTPRGDHLVGPVRPHRGLCAKEGHVSTSVGVVGAPYRRDRGARRRSGRRRPTPRYNAHPQGVSKIGGARGAGLVCGLTSVEVGHQGPRGSRAELSSTPPCSTVGDEPGNHTSPWGESPARRVA